ncbi:MAG: LamG domain-containing protein, partial [Tannerella sp.]|nr:LamG domain-containing protein [Tannerella sp.]
RLREGGTPVERADDGVFGNHSAIIREGQWFHIPRRDCPALNIHGKEAGVTVVAWLKRTAKSNGECEAVAGIWNESERRRQYCLFLNLGIWESAQQVGGHISGVGGPTEGYKYCMDASIGQTRVPYGKWQCVAFTYDGRQVRSYLNGALDRREGRNPYPYAQGIFDGGENGGDFTVAAVNRSGETGNFFTGQLGGLAVYNRALTDREMAYLAGNIP